MALTAQANLYCSEADVQNLLSTVGEAARLDDDSSNTVAANSPGWLQAANYATARVKAYAQPRYEDADLATSYLVNEWATVIAAHWLCSRRGNPVPDSLKELMYGDGNKSNPGAMGELMEVRAGRFLIPDIGSRLNEGPAWSNVRVDPNYRTRQIRVERPVSERTPTQYPQKPDWASEFSFEI